ncbi:hypothetical protein B0H10DRAFT_1942552 [Mycena sp. CBHHK59/15]|nr:hypothetical protein B0H10DRAFT_1942552 [Mycena sp. CBHHK59/15]
MAQYPFTLVIESRLLPYTVANGFQMDSAGCAHKSRIPRAGGRGWIYRDFVFHKVLEHSAAVLTTCRERSPRRRDYQQRQRQGAVPPRPCQVRHAHRRCGGVAGGKDKRAGVATALVTYLLRCPVPQSTQHHDHRHHAGPDSAPYRLVRITARTCGIRIQCASCSPTAASARARGPDRPCASGWCSVFAPDAPVVRLKARPAALRLGELSRCDAVGVLCSPFVERHAPVADYLRRETGFSHAQRKELVKEVAVRCPEIESRGKTLKKLSEAFPGVRARIVQAVLGAHAVRVEDLPDAGEEEARSWPSDGGDRHRQAGQRLGDGGRGRDDEGTRTTRAAAGTPSLGGGGPEGAVVGRGRDESDEDSAAGAKRGVSKLGSIGLENLTTMIRRDEIQPGRVRRRIVYTAALAG